MLLLANSMTLKIPHSLFLLWMVKLLCLSIEKSDFIVSMNTHIGCYRYETSPIHEEEEKAFVLSFAVDQQQMQDRTGERNNTDRAKKSIVSNLQVARLLATFRYTKELVEFLSWWGWSMAIFRSCNVIERHTRWKTRFCYLHSKQHIYHIYLINTPSCKRLFEERNI